LYRLGSFLADYAGDLTGRAMLEESAAILEDLGEKYVLASVLISLGIVDVGFGDYAAARARFEYGLAIAREIEHPWGMGDALTNLGCVYRILGEYSTAQSHLENALQVYQEHGRSIWETDVRCALAENAISQGDFATARSCLQAASNLLGTSENKWLQTLVCYFRGLLAHYEGDGVAASLPGYQTALAPMDQTQHPARECSPGYHPFQVRTGLGEHPSAPTTDYTPTTDQAPEVHLARSSPVRVLGK
jgi:tetratricopeptide (TPR) repeat protein